MPEQARVNGEKVSTIQSLTARAQDLAHAVNWWNGVYVFLVALAVLVAGGVFIAQFVAIKRAQQLAKVQDGLIAEKDRQSVADSKDKDLKIANAQQAAGEANKAAAEATERATKAQESLSLAEQHSAEANAKAEGFRLDIAKANERAASANETAEREKLARLQLEARLADRVVTPQQQSRIVGGLQSIGKRTVDITIFGDTPEISIFSNAVLECFTKAEWSINISRPGGGGAYARGVLIGVKAGSPPEYTQASNLVITVLRESVGNGVGPWEYNKMTGGGIFSANSSVGKPTPAGESPLRIVIGSK